MIRAKDRVLAMCSGHPIYQFDGVTFTQLSAPIQPGFGVYVQGRLFVAGVPGSPNLVLASRAGDISIFPDNESPDSTSTSKASFIDITTTVGSSDKIVALGAFEGDKLAIFTTDQVVVYRVDADYRNWAIDNRAAIEIGGVSANSTIRIGQDLVFGSRYGVRAGALEMQARTLHLINALTYLGDPAHGFSPDEVRRKIYGEVAKMPIVAIGLRWQEHRCVMKSVNRRLKEAATESIRSGFIVKVNARTADDAKRLRGVRRRLRLRDQWPDTARVNIVWPK
jgi:hypothetical protein